MTARTTAYLGDFGQADLESAGGKGAALGELLRQGFPVPQGFIVTTSAYRSFLAETGLGMALEGVISAGAMSSQDLASGARAGENQSIQNQSTGASSTEASSNEDSSEGAAVRQLFTHATMPQHLRTEIAGAYASLGGGAVAVRSSATAEDLPGAAFAGQQDTFLNVDGEESVLRAVVDCWASLWTDRAMAYRRRLEIDPREVVIAVVVQKMVPADVAGVMFTANPVTGERYGHGRIGRRAARGGGRERRDGPACLGGMRLGPDLQAGVSRPQARPVPGPPKRLLCGGHRQRW